MTKTRRCGQDQEMRKSSGKLGGGTEAAGVTATEERGSPPSGCSNRSEDAGSAGSSDEGFAGKFPSGELGGLSSKRLIVFRRGVSGASRRPARRPRAARAARGGR